MSVSVKTRTILWGRAAQRCAFPGCKLELVMDATHADDASLVGEHCHVVAHADTGPRGVYSLSGEERRKYTHLIEGKDKYANLVLLCNVHHKLIDDHSGTYTIEALLRMKANHETWVRESLQEFDQAKQSDHEVYATYVEEWMNRVCLDDWLDWTSWLLGVDPQITKDHLAQLEELRYWLLSRVWPERYDELECAFDNFLRILSDLRNTFLKHARTGLRQDEMWTERFYKSDRFLRSDSEYDRLLDEYNFHVTVVHDLVLELTRAANYICDRVRQFIDSSFRIDKGVLIVQRTDGFTTRTLRPEYRTGERTLTPYPGLEQFKRDRKDRDFFVGKGTSIDDPDADFR